MFSAADGKRHCFVAPVLYFAVERSMIVEPSVLERRGTLSESHFMRLLPPTLQKLYRAAPLI